MKGCKSTVRLLVARRRRDDESRDLSSILECVITPLPRAGSLCFAAAIVGASIAPKSKAECW